MPIQEASTLTYPSSRNVPGGPDRGRSVLRLFFSLSNFADGTCQFPSLNPVPLRSLAWLIESAACSSRPTWHFSPSPLRADYSVAEPAHFGAPAEGEKARRRTRLAFSIFLSRALSYSERLGETYKGRRGGGGKCMHYSNCSKPGTEMSACRLGWN